MELVELLGILVKRLKIYFYLIWKFCLIFPHSKATKLTTFRRLNLLTFFLLSHEWQGFPFSSFSHTYKWSFQKIKKIIFTNTKSLNLNSKETFIVNEIFFCSKLNSIGFSNLLYNNNVWDIINRTSIKKKLVMLSVEYFENEKSTNFQSFDIMNHLCLIALEKRGKKTFIDLWPLVS